MTAPGPTDDAAVGDDDGAARARSAGETATATAAARSGDETSIAGVTRILVLDTMLGWTTRHSRSQGEQVAARLEADGLEIRAGSRRAGRLARLIDMLWLVLRWARWAEVASIAVYSGPAFLLADLSSRLAARLGLPVVLVLHGGELPAYAERHPRRVRALLARAQVVVAPSSFNADRLAPYDDRPIQVIANVVDVDVDAWRARPQPRPRILWMRSLHPLYGPEVAIEVMADLVAVRPDATLRMAGPDKAQLTEELTGLIERRGLTDQVELVGFLDAEAKRREFADHDVYLNTSRADNTPVALLEAAASGLLVVSTDAGGIPDLFRHGHNALLAPVDDAEALANSVLSLLDDPARAAAQAGEARDLAHSMTWAELAPRWHQQFEAARSAGRGGLGR